MCLNHLYSSKCSFVYLLWKTMINAALNGNKFPLKDIYKKFFMDKPIWLAYFLFANEYANFYAEK